MATSLVIAACTSCSSPDDEAFVASPTRESKTHLDPPVRPSATWYNPASPKRDFGLVLAGTDVSRSHTFRISNVSSRPVQIRGVANRKPCCGDVAPVGPTIIEPGQALEVPVTIKLGLGSGNVVHVAAIEVEGDDQAINLYTTATAQARATVDEVEPMDGAVEIGQSRRVRYLIRSYGVASDPPRPLDDSAIRCELPTEWVGPATIEADRQDHLIMIHRLLAVTLPASREPARRTAELEVRDGNGALIGRRQVAWEVPSILTASPAGFVFGTSTGADHQLKVIVRCRDNRPFRIDEAKTDVAGLVVEVDGGAKPLHTMKARLIAQDLSKSRTGEVVIRTDHPSQSVIKLAVYVASPGNVSTAP